MDNSTNLNGNKLLALAAIVLSFIAYLPMLFLFGSSALAFVLYAIFLIGNIMTSLSPGSIFLAGKYVLLAGMSFYWIYAGIRFVYIKSLRFYTLGKYSTVLAITVVPTMLAVVPAWSSSKHVLEILGVTYVSILLFLLHLTLTLIGWLYISLTVVDQPQRAKVWRRFKLLLVIIIMFVVGTLLLTANTQREINKIEEGSLVVSERLKKELKVVVGEVELVDLRRGDGIPDGLNMKVKLFSKEKNPFYVLVYPKVCINKFIGERKAHECEGSALSEIFSGTKPGNGKFLAHLILPGENIIELENQSRIDPDTMNELLGLQEVLVKVSIRHVVYPGDQKYPSYTERLFTTEHELLIDF